MGGSAGGQGGGLVLPSLMEMILINQLSAGARTMKTGAQ